MVHYRRFVSDFKARRKMLKVTQAQLAEISGVSLRTLKAFESGEGNPTLNILNKLAEALGLEITLQVKQRSPVA